MGQFKRARLSGSDELFRPTVPAPAAPEAPEEADAGSDRSGEPAGTIPAGANAHQPQPAGGTLSVGLSVSEVKAIVDALQLARFPERQRTRPTMVEFERLGELQDRLRRLVAE